MTEQLTGATGARPVDELPPYQLARRQRIVDAGLRALQDQDYEQVQIRDVARSAGVALGTLYRYFSSKEHLYAAVLLQWAEQGRASRRPRSSESTQQRLRHRIAATIRAFERSPQFYRASVQLQSTTDPNATVIMTEFAAVAQQLLVDELSALEPVEAQDHALMLWAIVSTALTTAIYRHGSMQDAYRVAERFVDLIADRLDEAERALDPPPGG